MKCAICKKEPRSYLWQPCGPAETFDLFMFPGWHYRGFPAIACCDTCRATIQANQTSVTFTYRKTKWQFAQGKITPAPAHQRAQGAT